MDSCARARAQPYARRCTVFSIVAHSSGKKHDSSVVLPMKSTFFSLVAHGYEKTGATIEKTVHIMGISRPKATFFTGKGATIEKTVQPPIYPSPNRVRQPVR
ncbi:MAG: hypothetical protein Q4D27_06340 [Coriobacteriia bacterium]|nr:hypothetical protein [Coriobacteriia bacterium]